MLKQNLPQVYAKGGGASALHFRRLTAIVAEVTAHYICKWLDSKTNAEASPTPTKSPYGTAIP